MSWTEATWQNVKAKQKLNWIVNVTKTEGLNIKERASGVSGIRVCWCTDYSGLTRMTLLKVCSSGCSVRGDGSLTLGWTLKSGILFCEQRIFYFLKMRIVLRDLQRISNCHTSISMTISSLVDDGKPVKIQGRDVGARDIAAQIHAPARLWNEIADKVGENNKGCCQ